jgi:hypothetical protein
MAVFLMPTKCRLLLLAVATSIAAASSGFASVPTDTIRAGQCSPKGMIEPGSNAAWVRVVADWFRETPGAWSNDSLRTELIALEAKDQAVRRGVTQDSVENAAFMRRMRVVDSSNTARMRVILAQYGWPGKSLVGARGAYAAFVLVRPSPALGSEGLALMQSVKPGEVSPQVAVTHGTRRHVLR